LPALPTGRDGTALGWLLEPRPDATAFVRSPAVSTEWVRSADGRLVERRPNGSWSDSVAGSLDGIAPLAGRLVERRPNGSWSDSVAGVDGQIIAVTKRRTPLTWEESGACLHVSGLHVSGLHVSGLHVSGLHVSCLHVSCLHVS